jgi:uncharacterized protein (DUF2249 family)
MISELHAIEVARAFLLGAKHVPWHQESLEVRGDAIEGRRAWVVSALDALEPGNKEWMRGDHEPTSCFVDMETGRLFGFEVRRSRTIFKEQLR